MKTSVVITFLVDFILPTILWAQSVNTKPLWMNELPLATEGGEFRRTVGEGKSMQKAKQNAIMGYIRDRNFELGLTVSTEGMESLYADTESEAGNYFINSSSREQEGLNQGTRLKSEENKIRFRVVESYSETSLLGDVKVWCLIWQPEEGASVRPPRLTYATASAPMRIPDGGYVALPSVARPFRNPGLAWLAPGAAHLHNKRYKKGVTMLLGSAVLVSVSGGLFLSAMTTNSEIYYDPETGISDYSDSGSNFVKNITGVVLMVANVGIYAWSIADAYVSAREARKLGANDRASRSFSVSPWMSHMPMGYGNGQMATGISLRYGF